MAVEVANFKFEKNVEVKTVLDVTEFVPDPWKIWRKVFDLQQPPSQNTQKFLVAGLVLIVVIFATYVFINPVGV